MENVLRNANLLRTLNIAVLSCLSFASTYCSPSTLSDSSWPGAAGGSLKRSAKEGSHLPTAESIMIIYIAKKWSQQQRAAKDFSMFPVVRSLNAAFLRNLLSFTGAADLNEGPDQECQKRDFTFLLQGGADVPESQRSSHLQLMDLCCSGVWTSSYMFSTSAHIIIQKA